MSLHEYLQDDPACEQLLVGAVLAVGPMLQDPNPGPTLSTVEGWVSDLAGRMPLPWSLDGAMDILNDFLFQEVGLQGDRNTYDDPANAALPLVLARKRGLPVTLSILWLEVARRLGFRGVGVALPGHFVVGLELDVGTLYYDPFSGGRAIGEEGLAQVVALATGGRSALAPSMLVPASNRAILTRLVRNLQVHFQRNQAWDEALWTSTHLVLLAPEDSHSYRDRALVHFQRGETAEGLSDLHEAIRLSQAQDPELTQWLAKLQGD